MSIFIMKAERENTCVNLGIVGHFVVTALQKQRQEDHHRVEAIVVNKLSSG